MTVHNFNAGPSMLPPSVIAEATRAVQEFEHSGMSILEISHRSPGFMAVLDEAETLVRALLKLPEEYAVLFLTGGASTQFFMAPLNLLPQNEKAAYVDTGSWSAKAIKEARRYGHIDVLASSKAQNYAHIPKGYDLPVDTTYLHLTSNNTIFGTQYQVWPETDVPLVCDMSSDIFSRPVPANRFDLIYAGAQKNLGPAGVTLVIVRKSALGKTGRDIPTMLDYNTHISKHSSFNTPPVFPIYVSMLTLRWILETGGLHAMQQRNEEKATLLYEEIDANPFFRGVVSDPADRSKMNVTFVMADRYRELEADFLAACREANCVGVKGHRSAGGFRASIYNAMPLEGVQALVEVMRSFSLRYG
ncbi:MAG: 3-phosphoserine/phosphohydroxythreonine transaminase [Saprospiraceae bacterium]